MSKITVTTIAGLTSGGDANKVKIESGDALEVVSGTASINNTSNGTLASFKKSGTTIGHIGVHDDDGFFFTRGASQQGIVLKNSSLMPCNTDGSNSDNDQDLGISSVRWKDLYLSGGLKIGGTGAANTLDDYEEGNWTPTLTAASSNPTVSSYDYNLGVYTKIGRTVHAGLYLRIQGGNMSGGSGDGRISGLPFASSSTNSIAWGAGGFSENWMKSNGSFSTNRNTFKPIVAVGGNVFELWQYSGTSPQYDTGWGINQIVTGDLIISGVFTYITDA